MNKMKVIHISTASSSLAVRDYEEDIYKNWNSQVALQVKKTNPLLEVESWAVERFYKKENERCFKGIKFRIFPTAVSIRHSMEISFSMIKAVLDETKEAEKLGKKLIIHFHEYHSWQVYLTLMLIEKSEEIKIIAQHHGARSPFENLKKYRRLFLSFPAIVLMQIFENLFLKKINIFYALSDNEINYLERVAQDSEKKFQPMGIEDKYFRKENKIRAKKKLGLSLNKKYVLYVGRIKSTKGIKELLGAVKGINLELLLMGDGPDRKKYEDYAKKMNIHNVNFLGSIYDDKKLEYLSACDCLILPSYTEGAPVVLMEAIARNIPVVATNVGGIPKMIKNGREGIIIKPKSELEIRNAIEKILKWKKKNISKYAEKYKWGKIIKDTLGDYEK